jgi:hypothetical protein
MPRRPLDKLLSALGRRKPRALVVVVQTERGQVTVPADRLREHLRAR